MGARVRKSRQKEAAGTADADHMQIEWSQGEVLKWAEVCTEAEEGAGEGEAAGIDAQGDFAERFELGELSSRRPEVRARTSRILPDDWATAASRMPLWLSSGWGCRGRRL